MLLSLDLELAKRYLTALVKAVFPVAADKSWNLGIVVGRNAIVVEIVEQSEKPAADARAAQFYDWPIHPVGCADPAPSSDQFAIDPPLDAVAGAVIPDLIKMPISHLRRRGLAQDRIGRIGTELLALEGQPLIERPDPVIRDKKVEH